MDTKALFNIGYGLYVLTTNYDNIDNGCIVNTVIQVTSNPLQVSVTVNKGNYTHDLIKDSCVFNVSMLTTETPMKVFEHFGFQSGRDTDKTVGISFKRSANGVVYLDSPEVNAYISGKVTETIDLGTHTLFIADVTDGEVMTGDASATYAYYFAHIKPAPEAKQESKKGWICTICGYIYEGEELPADFICPVCKHPASDFKKL